jgi:hypothetical protein
MAELRQEMAELKAAYVRLEIRLRKQNETEANDSQPTVGEVGRTNNGRLRQFPVHIHNSACMCVICELCSPWIDFLCMDCALCIGCWHTHAEAPSCATYHNRATQVSIDFPRLSTELPPVQERHALPLVMGGCLGSPCTFPYVCNL